MYKVTLGTETQNCPTLLAATNLCTSYAKETLKQPVNIFKGEDIALIMFRPIHINGCKLQIEPIEHPK